MEHGDLSTYALPRMVVVLEGVLVDIEETTTGRIRKETTRSYHWLETPLKRLVYLRRTYPDTSIDIVTFISSEVATHAADFLDRHDIPITSSEYHTFSEWAWSLRLHPEIVAIYDSDPERLHKYGQLGVAVVRGGDF